MFFKYLYEKLVPPVSKQPTPTGATQNSQNWQAWKGKVIGTQEDIENALKSLNRPPKDAKELEDIISKDRQAKLDSTLKRGADDFW